MEGGLSGTRRLGSPLVGGFGGTKGAEWAGAVHALVGDGAGGGTECGAGAIVGIGAWLRGGRQAKGSFDVLGSKGGRTWKLGLGGHRVVQVSPPPTPVSFPPLSPSGLWSLRRG